MKNDNPLELTPLVIIDPETHKEIKEFNLNILNGLNKPLQRPHQIKMRQSQIEQVISLWRLIQREVKSSNSTYQIVTNPLF